MSNNGSSISNKLRSGKVLPNDFIDNISCVKTAVRPTFANQQLKIEIKAF